MTVIRVKYLHLTVLWLETPNNVDSGARVQTSAAWQYSEHLEKARVGSLRGALENRWRFLFSAAAKGSASLVVTSVPTVWCSVRTPCLSDGKKIRYNEGHSCLCLFNFLRSSPRISDNWKNSLKTDSSIFAVLLKYHSLVIIITKFSSSP